MICKFCGNSIEDNSDFCFICGQKVEQEAASFASAESNDVFSQSTQAVTEAAEPVQAEEAQVVPVENPAEAPAQQTEVAPVVCPIQAGATNVQCPYQNAPAQDAKKGKKNKKNKDKSQPTKALKFFTVLFLALFLALAAFMSGVVRYVFIALVVIYAIFDIKAYKSAQKLGYEAKSIAILNATGIGAIIGMAAVLIKLFMAAYM